jgi:hypothetical protein
MAKPHLRTGYSLILAVLLAAGGCTNGPTQPSSGSVGAPALDQPADGAVIADAAQPVVLTVDNAVVTGSTRATYTFQVASDAGFAAIVQTKSSVAAGTGGRTSIALDALPSAAQYYWRARADAGSTSGAFGPTWSFSIGAAVTLGVPIPVGPLSGATSATRPTFTVQNVTRSGPAGPITYTFQVSTSETFTDTVASGKVSEGSSTTSFTPADELASGPVYYWRATAADDADGVTSAPSGVQSFTVRTSPAQQLATAEGITLWPGVQPPGVPGHVVLGDGWSVGPRVSYWGEPYVSPTITVLQILDLLDRGMPAGDTIGWLRSHGYETDAAWYPDIEVFGFIYDYMALVEGHWHLVRRVGA